METCESHHLGCLNNDRILSFWKKHPGQPTEMGWMQEVPVLLCNALGWRAQQEDLMIFCGLKLHIPRRSPAGVSTALLPPRLGFMPGAFAVCSLHPWFPCGREDVGSMQGERGSKPFQKLQRPGSRAATLLCSFHPGLPIFSVMMILLASWDNYGPFSIPISESIDGRSTNATM